MQSIILPKLPIVGYLELQSRDGKSIAMINVTKKRPTKLTPFFEMCFKELESFLIGKSQTLNLPLDFNGLSDFQLKVMKEMKKIPYGEVQSYRDIAQRLNSRAYQAIGNACGKNPFLLIYPCHRVVGSSGPGGFAHGPKMKKELLKLEGFNHDLIF